jgi:Archaeal putative transposase ISC1217
VEVCTLPCLWYGALRTDAARLVLIREPGRRRAGAGYDIALITTDLRATAEDIVARYAARWSIEVTFHDAKNLLGVGEAQNRLRKAVERTVPFGLFCQTLLTIWYATTGGDPDDIATRRAQSPWYTTKQHPSTRDFLTKFRRTVIAARFKPTSPRTATPEEIHAIHLAWEAAAA